MPKKAKTGSTSTKKNKTSSAKKESVKQATSPAQPTQLRRLRPPKRKLLRKNKIKFVSKAVIPPAPKIFINSLKLLKKYWHLFLMLTVIYAIVNLIFVHGLTGGTDLKSIQSTLSASLKGFGGKLLSGTALFVYLIGGGITSSANSSASAGAYQTILLIVMSLAIIWALRNCYNNSVVKARDCFYKGMYPIVPVVLVVLVIGLELIPFLIGVFVFSTVIANGISTSGAEDFAWLVFLVALSAVSFFMVCSSIFALYTVTLPDMTPMKALRSARPLVRYRRLKILRKLFFLPVALFILGAIIMMPFLLFLTPLANWVFFVLSLMALPIVHSYMYALYRELLV